MDQRVYLKVKIKSLAAEARIIRLEESRNRTFRHGLASHRREIVRPAARSALLAYGFLRGRPYHALESKCEVPPDWKEVERLVKKYGVIRLWNPGEPYQTVREERQTLENEQAERFTKWREGVE